MNGLRELVEYVFGEVKEVKNLEKRRLVKYSWETLLIKNYKFFIDLVIFVREVFVFVFFRREKR